jgi:hypothetical protein
LLDALDPQRQRILASFLVEEIESSLVLGPPTATLSETLEQEAQPLVSGDYVRLLTDEETELRKEAARRADQLMQGDQR